MKELEIFEYSTYPKDRLELVIDDELMRLEESVDYIFVKQERRYINLDNVFFREPGYVVTGLKLSVDPENFESLQLAVHITPFDFDSGSLTPTDDKPSKWIIYKYMSDEDRKFENRTKIDAAKKDIPTKYYGHVPSSEDFSVTWFEPLERFLDRGRNAFPFFDSRLVALQPRIPLEGVSLYYRGKENSAGFVGFRMTTLDIPAYLDPQMSQQDLEFL
ncbi:GSCOCG00011829001-RA-CDS [Cotesia congregata]|nr:GSCOCG00011829001-RA-CDS [Cotesia congregata]